MAMIMKIHSRHSSKKQKCDKNTDKSSSRDLSLIREMTPMKNDICSRAESLQIAYDKLIAGEKAASVRIDLGDGVVQDITYAHAHLSRLAAELAEAKRQCASLKKRHTERRGPILIR